MNTQPSPAGRRAAPAGATARNTSTTATTASPPACAVSATEADILDASPLDLARLLCGPGLLGDLRRPANATREHLAAAGKAMGEPFNPDADADTTTPADLAATRQALRAALACAIRPDGIDCRAETILVQVALWLVDMQSQVDEVAALYTAAAAAAAAASQTKH